MVLSGSSTNCGHPWHQSWTSLSSRRRSSNVTELRTEHSQTPMRVPSKKYTTETKKRMAERRARQVRQARQATPSKSNHTREDLRHDSRLQPITHIRSIHISSVLPFASILFFFHATRPCIQASLGHPAQQLGRFMHWRHPLFCVLFGLWHLPFWKNTKQASKPDGVVGRMTCFIVCSLRKRGDTLPGRWGTAGSGRWLVLACCRFGGVWQVWVCSCVGGRTKIRIQLVDLLLIPGFTLN